MTYPRLLSATAAVSALVLCGTASSAGAATASQPAAGAASSALQLVSAAVAGHTLSAGTISLLADARTATKVGKAVITPVMMDGTAYGEQTVTPAASPKTVGGASSPSTLAGLLSIASPTLAATVTNKPSAAVSSTSLGSLKVLGLSVPLTGSLGVSSLVDAATGASATKQVTLKNLALPSIADLLAALGIDLSKLPVSTLTSLLDQLALVSGAVDSAQAAVASGQATLDGLVTSLTSAQSALTTASSALSTALAAIPGAPSLSAFLAETSVLQQAFITLNPTIGPLLTAYNTASAAVTAAQGLVDTAQATLNGLIGTLVSAIKALLDGTPLLSIGTLSISSLAKVTSAKAGGQQAKVLGATLSGVKVLGTDVLQTALGTSTIDTAALTSSAIASVNSATSGLLGTLSSVLSAVPGLKVPAPTISLLAPSASTGIVNGFGVAKTSLSGLTIALPSITLPTALALPGAANLPALSAVTGTATTLVSAPLSVRLLTLSDQAAFRPAVVGSSTPGTSGTPPELAHTGLPVGLVVLALVTLGGAAVLRRRVTR
jgi:hypothetical protein